ncbi:YqgE/AlgH family protein [Botryobacter ruber]|uniref:YqgE/AlgH family protein n=1 Tax=Botryobacter ruber TaxID=2171629 RepID=UPI000E0BF028|nr:YqgE/AlgH family protein [Botryobacter ruber]
MKEARLTTPGAGSILISEPYLGDPNFERTVVLVCSHQESEGTFGLVINRMSTLKLSDVLEIPDVSTDFALGIGGPVQPDTLHYVHRFANVTQAVKLAEGVYWGGNFEEIRLMISAGLVSSSDIRFFLGYSGWIKNQLQEEVDKNVWIVNNNAANKLFNLEADSLWRNILRQMGGKYKVLSNYPIDPRLN